MPNSNYHIKSVESNIEKSESYKENFKIYKRAEKSKFYFECLWILYAMSEDRTSAFLYHIGFTSAKKRNSATGSKKIKKQVREIIDMKNKNDKYKFDSFGGKLSRIKKVISWSQNSIDKELTDYKKSVKKAIKNVISDEEFFNSLLYLENEWRDKRNQLTHALFTKNYNSVESELKILVESGYKAIRILDKGVNQIKKENIRQQFKIA